MKFEYRDGRISVRRVTGFAIAKPSHAKDLYGVVLNVKIAQIHNKSLSKSFIAGLSSFAITTTQVNPDALCHVNAEIAVSGLFQAYCR